MNTYFTVTAKQIQTLQGTCYCTARKEWHRLRDVLKLTAKEPLRLKDVAAVWDTSAADLATALYKKYTK